MSHSRKAVSEFFHCSNNNAAFDFSLTGLIFCNYSRLRLLVVIVHIIAIFTLLMLYNYISRESKVTLVCVSVRGLMPTLLRGPGCNLGSGRGCPLVVHY